MNRIAIALVFVLLLFAVCWGGINFSPNMDMGMSTGGGAGGSFPVYSSNFIDTGGSAFIDTGGSAFKDY